MSFNDYYHTDDYLQVPDNQSDFEPRLEDLERQMELDSYSNDERVDITTVTHPDSGSDSRNECREPMARDNSDPCVEQRDGALGSRDDYSHIDQEMEPGEDPLSICNYEMDANFSSSLYEAYANGSHNVVKDFGFMAGQALVPLGTNLDIESSVMEICSHQLETLSLSDSETISFTASMRESCDFFWETMSDDPDSFWEDSSKDDAIKGYFSVECR